MYKIFTKTFTIAEDISDFVVAKTIAIAFGTEPPAEVVYIIRTNCRGARGDVVAWKVFAGKLIEIGIVG